MDRARGTYGERRNTYRILMGKTEGKRQFGSPNSRWKVDIVMDLTEEGWKCYLYWIILAEDMDKCCGHCNELIL